MPRRPTLMLRVDAGRGVGAGHLARCLVLARRWQAGHGDATVVAGELPAPWAERVADAGVEWRRPDDTPVAADWVVADGYELRTEQLEELGRRGRLLRIDDFGESEIGPAELVLDQNVASSADDYPGCETLVGPRFVLLAPESRIGAPADIAPEVRTVVVGLGGFPDDELKRFVDGVLDRWAPVADVTVLDGRSDVDAALARADLVLTTAGTFCWQVCHRGIPSVVICTAENQRRLAQGLAGVGAARFAGPAEASNEDRVAHELAELAHDHGARVEMARRARALVDGHGAARVVAHLKAALLDLRPVARADADLLLRWANDPGTREASFDSSPIEPHEHLDWLETRLDDARAKQWIAGFDETPIGIVRFSVPRDGRCEISLTVAPDQRGTGWAAALISAGTRRILAAGDVTKVTARIRAENAASISAFVAAGYDESAATLDHASVEYVRRYVEH